MALSIRESDEHFMRHALRLATRGLGRTWPNPSVGCILVKDGQIIGEGVTGKSGRPHAETQALAQAGKYARGSTAYVTLEPCSHHGKTPPCADTLVEAGIGRVVIACEDLDPRVSGSGANRLREAGIPVANGIGQKEAQEINAGFFSLILHNRPIISLKIATSLDGKIANSKGESQWITGEPARNYGHGLRSRYDAILTGIGTVLADDPMLNCRLPGLEKHSPIRVIMDTQLRLPPESKLAKTATQSPVWVLTSEEALASPNRAALETAGCTVAAIPRAESGELSLEAACHWLAGRGITRVLAEPGATLATALYKSGLVQKLYWFRAPIILGDGKPAFTGDFASPSSLPRLQVRQTITLGKDVLEIYSL